MFQEENKDIISRRVNFISLLIFQIGWRWIDLQNYEELKIFRVSWEVDDSTHFIQDGRMEKQFPYFWIYQKYFATNPSQYVHIGVRISGDTPANRGLH